ncbi:helix-turn-helix domain-containing protein [Streptomyces sp. NBC_00268]|uniref:helix-turn-helix domain-containing protein n=1 Tax=Streptomyces sp. NBC_00268 TaxID=2975695 RepID=UPI002257A257|nr:helix-turn-helix domain-containing protein [Streptomyces sp. NBC_00268]MCX5182170.1 helix-turn-helix domain-containing protein [Streptomyces sp. NBC_00268]
MSVRAEELPEPAAPSPPPGLVTVGRFDQRPGYRVNRPRGSDSWLFIWTTGGRGRLRQGAARTAAGPGDLVVLGPGVPQRYAVEPGAGHWAFWWAHCQARPSWTGWLRPYAVDDGLYAVGPALGRERIEAAFCRMLTDARWTGHGPPPEDAEPLPGEVAVAHGTAARELALCSLEEIVLLAAARAERSRPDLDARVRHAEAVMAADPGAPHTVRSLAAAVALSPSRFAHLFTEQLGRSPMRALRESRLLHAARLLEATELPVERVAAASGFTSAFHFSRVFRQRYGTPPGAYRKGTARSAANAGDPEDTGEAGEAAGSS